MVDSQKSTENFDETPGVAAQRQFEAEMRQAEGRPATEHSNDPPDASDDCEGLGDPSPPKEDASLEEKRLYSQNVNAYARQMLNHFQSLDDLKGEELWIEYTCTFRKESIIALTSTLQLDWARLLRSRGVHVKMRRGTKRYKALIETLQSAIFVPCEKYNRENPIAHNSVQHQTNPSASNHYVEITADKEKHQNQDAELNDNKSEPAFIASAKAPVTSSHTSSGSSSARRAPLETLMKAYSHQMKYSGSFVEDFEGAVEQFNTYCQLFEFSEEEKAKGFQIMLTGAAFAHYSRQFSKKEMSYTQLVNAFRSWYTSEEQKKRLLNVWQTPSLTRELQAAPEKSELEVFQKLSEQLVKVQNQLHSDYHHDRFLRDQLVRAADIPHLQHSESVERLSMTRSQKPLKRLCIA